MICDIFRRGNLVITPQIPYLVTTNWSAKGPKPWAWKDILYLPK